jgi:hypothetical protein
LSGEHRRDSILLVEDFPGAARQIVESIGREYEIVHTGAFDVARKLFEHIAFDHYIFDIDFPDSHTDWLRFIHEAIELRVDPSVIAAKYYNYGNGLRLFDILRQVWGNNVHVLFQSGSLWGSYETTINRLKAQCPNISFLGKYPFLVEPLHYFRLSLPQPSGR